MNVCTISDQVEGSEVINGFKCWGKLPKICLFICNVQTTERILMTFSAKVRDDKEQLIIFWECSRSPSASRNFQRMALHYSKSTDLDENFREE